ncbi:hypothetical protein T03_17888 [Trichinella britovi]|uniref:Uncharacterized protein n=1 Tax=Trichinella britovi TaxID=45882 RepID=A0A0V1C8T6_TRIBR|nr:hypothetical protein T03_17888 [Trichinella britovi]
MKKAKASDWESFEATVAFRRPLPLLMFRFCGLHMFRDDQHYSGYSMTIFRNERDMSKLSRFTSSLTLNDSTLAGCSLH